MITLGVQYVKWNNLNWDDGEARSPISEKCHPGQPIPMCRPFGEPEELE
jgi:hypothetical protein